jgi:hypothetical protein
VPHRFRESVRAALRRSIVPVRIFFLESLEIPSKLTFINVKQAEVIKRTSRVCGGGKAQ